MPKMLGNIANYYKHISDIIQTNHFYISFCRIYVHLGEYLSLSREDYAFRQKQNYADKCLIVGENQYDQQRLSN